MFVGQELLVGSFGERSDRLFLCGDLFIMSRLRLNFSCACDSMFVPLRDGFQAHHRLRALENAGQRVVIRRRDGIELVIVTTRATDGDAQYRATERVHLLIDDVHFHFHFVGLSQHFWPESHARIRNFRILQASE